MHQLDNKLDNLLYPEGWTLANGVRTWTLSEMQPLL